MNDRVVKNPNFKNNGEKHLSEDVKLKISASLKQYCSTDEGKQARSAAMKELWQNKAYREKMLKIRQSEEARQRISLINSNRTGENNPMYGIPFSKEHRRKLSEARKGKPLPQEVKDKLSRANKGRIPWMGGKHHSEDTRGRISATMKEQGFSPQANSKTEWVPWNKGRETGLVPRNAFKKGHIPWVKGRHLSEEQKAKLREIRLKQVIPKNDTSIEIAVQNELNRRGIPFGKHVPLLNKYQVDLFLGDNLIIECDGDYWHSLPERIEHDRKRDHELEDAGYVIFRLKEHEINSDVFACVDKVLEVTCG